MNWTQFKDLLCYPYLAAAVVASWSLTQEVESVNSLFKTWYFSSLHSANSVKIFSENSFFSIFWRQSHNLKSIVVGMLHLPTSDGSRIYQTGGRKPLSSGQKLITWQDFCRNCMGMNEIGPRGTSQSPPWICQYQSLILFIQWSMLDQWCLSQNEGGHATCSSEYEMNNSNF